MAYFRYIDDVVSFEPEPGLQTENEQFTKNKLAKYLKNGAYRKWVEVLLCLLDSKRHLYILI